MPPLPSPGLVVRISWETEDDSGVPAGSRAFFSYHGSAMTQGVANGLAAAVVTAWGDNIAPIVATTDTLTSVTVQDLSSDTGVVAETTATTAGSGSGNAMPPNIAININHVIARRYRGGKPKTFLRAGTVSDVHATLKNEWSAAFIATATTAWQAFVSDVLAASGANLSNIVNVSWYQGFTPVLNPVTGRTRDVAKLRADGPITDVVTDAIVRPKFGSQRRRLDV
jgi:hypothetical protein